MAAENNKDALEERQESKNLQYIKVILSLIYKYNLFLLLFVN